MCEPLTADFVTLLHAYAGAKACHPTRQRRLRESNPPTLADSCFQDSVLDQPDSLLRIVNQAAAARIERALTRSKRVVRTFTLRRNKFSPQQTGSRRIERRLTGSEPVVRPLHQKPVRVGGIEPPLPVWKTDVLPLHHTRESGRDRSRTCKAVMLACFRDRSRRQSACPSNGAAEAGIEPAGDVLNRHAQLPTVAPPQCGEDKVILSEAKNPESPSTRQILRSAQDDG